MRVLPTERSDAAQLDCQSVQLKDWGTVGKGLEAMDAETLRTLSRSFWHKGEVVAIAGMLPRWANSWVGFTVLGKYVLEHPYRFCMLYSDGLDEMIEAFHVERLEVTARCDHPGIMRWMKFLGFEVEGKLRRYGLHGEDAWILSRISEKN